MLPLSRNPLSSGLHPPRGCYELMLRTVIVFSPHPKQPKVATLSLRARSQKARMALKVLLPSILRMPHSQDAGEGFRMRASASGELRTCDRLFPLIPGPLLLEPERRQRASQPVGEHGNAAPFDGTRAASRGWGAKCITRARNRIQPGDRFRSRQSLRQ
jgi:hypothetical protein